MDKVLDKRKWHFTIIDNAILYSNQLSEHEKIIYTLLCSFTNTKTCECYPSIKTLSEYAKISQNTVRTALKELKEKGLIDVKERKINGNNLSNLYIISELPNWILEETRNIVETTSSDEGVLQPLKGGTSTVEGGVLQPLKGGTSTVEDELYQYNYNHINDNNLTDVVVIEQQQQLKKIIDAFNNNIHLITPIELEKINSWLQDIDAEVIILAIEETVAANKRNFKYINAILNNWLNQGFKTKADVETYLRDWQDKKQNKNCANATSWGKEFDFTDL